MARLDGQELWNFAQSCRFDGLDQPHITADDLSHALSEWLPHSLVSIELLGHSSQGRPIHSYTLGEGTIPVLAWSQMHGNEPTATASLVDLISGFIRHSSTAWVKSILQSVTLTLVPQLNPDGAHYRTRENAQGIDINRDAMALQTPEGQILNALLRRHNSGIAFNLHDQSRDYANGLTGEPVNLAFLSPPADSNLSITPARSRAIRIIGEWFNTLNQKDAYSLTRYQDDYTDTAFGELASALGWSCILIESAPGQQDPNRQLARNLTLFCLLHALQQTAFGHESEDLSNGYWQLPINRENVYVDRLWRNLLVRLEDNQFYADFAINEEEGVNCLVQLGDLHNLRGYLTEDFSGLIWQPLRTIKVECPTVLDNQQHLKWLQQGYGQVYDPHGWVDHRSDYPLLKVTSYEAPLRLPLAIKGQPLNGQVLQRDRVIKVLIKGRLIDFEKIDF